MTTTYFQVLKCIAFTMLLGLSAQVLPEPQPPIVPSIAPPPPPPATLAEKVKRAERIVIAKVGRLQYMRWKSPSDPLGPWDVSDTPLAGYVLYMNLVEDQVILEEQPSSEAQRDSLRHDLPLWVGATCFGFGLVGDRYQNFPAPVGESRVFLLSSKLLGSNNKIYSSNCWYPALPVTEVQEIQRILRGTPFKSK